MKKKEKSSITAFYILVSVLAAIALWIYVGNVANPDESTKVGNVPVIITGTNILESRGLVLSEIENKTVTLHFSGKRNVTRLLSAETVSATVDVSGIQDTGEQTLSYQISYNLPSSSFVSSLTVTAQYPSAVTVKVGRFASRSIPVSGSVTGSVADGYQAGEFTFSPENIQVSGDESLVNQIDHAQVTLDVTDMSTTYDGELPYTFITHDKQTIEADKLDVDKKLVRASLPIIQLKEIELTVDLLPGGGIKEENIEYTVSPESIVVSGIPDDLKYFKSISLGKIDLYKILSDKASYTLPITLPAEVTNVSGLTEAEVTVEVHGLSTATWEVTNIELLNVPSGYTAEQVTKSCRVVIRGDEEAVSSVASSQIRLLADLQDAVVATGTQTVPCRVIIDGNNDVGAVGDYSIVVSVTKS